MAEHEDSPEDSSTGTSDPGVDAELGEAGAGSEADGGGRGGAADAGAGEPGAGEPGEAGADGAAGDGGVDGGVDGGAGEGGENAGGVGGDGGRGRRRLLGVLAVVAAALVAISGLVAWWHTASRDQPDPTATRDAVLIAATQHIATLNTLDYRKVDQGLSSWQAVTTGMLHDQLGEVDAEERQLLADQGKISTGRVVDAGVLEVGSGTATVIAAVEVTVRDGAKPDEEPSVKRNRFTADLVRVGGQWKLESLQQVAVNVS